MPTLRVTIPQDISDSLAAILTERQITVDQVVSVYLRAMVNAHESGKELTLESTFRFGKYYGAKVAEVAVVDPGYITFLMGSSRPTHFSADVIELVQGTK